jgi:hypothetical protein
MLSKEFFIFWIFNSFTLFVVKYKQNKNRLQEGQFNNQFQNCRITIDSIITNINPTYANFTHSIQKLDSGDTLMNITYYYAMDISQIIIHSELNIQKDKNDRNYERQLLKTSTNVCKMSQGVIGNFIAKMIRKYVESDMKCPFKKVSYDLIKTDNSNNLRILGFLQTKKSYVKRQISATAFAN